MEIVWDENKRAANLAKHGVDFADAVGVFYDDQALTGEDEDAESEQRLLTLGMDFLGRILVVVHSESEDADIRMISARKASPVQRRQYER